MANLLDHLDAVQPYQQHLSTIWQLISLHTFRSPWRVIRILSKSVAFLAAWTIAQRVYLHAKCKLLRYPPGRFTGHPFFGSILSDSSLAVAAMAMGTIGPVSITKWGFDYVVFVNDVALLKHASHIYRDMNDHRTINLWGINDTDNQFFLIPGNDRWRERRRIAANAFLNPLNSKRLSERLAAILEEHIFPMLDAHCRQRTLYRAIRADMQYVVFAAICSASFGDQIAVPAYDDPFTAAYLRHVDTAGRNFFISVFLQHVLGVAAANFLLHTMLSTLRVFQEFELIVARQIEAYKASTNGAHCECYIGDMLRHVERGQLTPIEMLRDAQSMFLAGVDSTATSLEQAFFYLAKYPRIQQRVYDELRMYHDKYEQFSLQHVNELHVLRAFVYETLRNVLHLAASFPKYVSKDGLHIGGYRLRKGWYVIGNHYFINHSPANWSQPNEFELQHFLDAQQHFKLNKHFISFGYGKRDCMGQSLALKNLYLLLGHFILRYKLLASDEKAIQAMKHLPFDGFSIHSVPYVLQSRKS